MSTIGKCPACEKGEISEKEYNFVCNFSQDQQVCDFIIWKSFFGKVIDTDIATELITNKKTRVFNDFVSKKTNNNFSASIIINEHNKPSLSFENITHDIECVACGGKIFESGNGFFCEGKLEESCNMYVPKIIAGKELTTDQITLLLTGEKTDFIKGFKKSSGESFEAKLYVDDLDFKIKFDSSIIECPKCENGLIREFEKSFSCSNWNAEKKCDFTLWKSQNGGVVTKQNLLQLCNSNETNVIQFKKKDNTAYKGKLILDKDNNVSLQKIE